MSVEITKSNKAVELSEQELDTVAGGLDVTIGDASKLVDASSANFAQQDLSFAQQTFAGPYGSGNASALKLQNIKTDTGRITAVS